MKICYLFVIATFFSAFSNVHSLFTLSEILHRYDYIRDYIMQNAGLNYENICLKEYDEFECAFAKIHYFLMHELGDIEDHPNSNFHRDVTHTYNVCRNAILPVNRAKPENLVLRWSCIALYRRFDFMDTDE